MSMPTRRSYSIAALIASTILLPIASSNAHDIHSTESPVIESPLLVIGASYSEGKTPFNNGIAPLGGTSVSRGSYLSLGQALTRNHRLPGYVINEAEAGATTFPRPACPPGFSTCVAAGWSGYQTMLQRALARVGTPPAYSNYNANYVVITTPNDCLHSGAMGVPQTQAMQCSLVDMNDVADRLVAVGQYALSKGITPIYDIMPAYSSLDLPLFQQLNGQVWVIGEKDYNQLRLTLRTRISEKLPDALIVDMWSNFNHIGDGIHPDQKTAKKAADEIVNAIARHSIHSRSGR